MGKRLEILKTYTRSFPEISFQGGKKTDVKTVMQIGDIKTGKKKSSRGRAKVFKVLNAFFPKPVSKAVQMKLEKIRKFKKASIKVKNAIGIVNAFQVDSPKKSPTTVTQNAKSSLTK